MQADLARFSTRHAAVRRPRRSLPGWPLYLAFGLFPIWWVMGLSAFVWPLFAVPMALSLLRRDVRVPKGFGVWLLFLLWVLGSGTQLGEASRGITFGYRMGIYVAATIIFLYIYNTPRERLPDHRVVLAVALFWMTVTAGGFLGLLAPRLEFRSPLEAILPGGLTGNAFLHQLIHPASSQVQDIFGYDTARPKAPFEYTNVWGAVFALTTPFVILAWSYSRGPLWKWAIRLSLVAAVVPVAASLNRGLWLSLGLGLVYAAGRMAAAGRVRPLLGLGVGLALAFVLVFASPLGALIHARFTTEHSVRGRETLYSEATAGALQSPILGFGSPRPSESNPDLPEVGTHGQLWLVMYSHGFPGLAFYLGWFGWCFWVTRRGRSRLAFWCNVVVFISIVQLPYYAQLPAQIQVTMVAAALAMRELHEPGRHAGSATPLPVPADVPR